MRHDDLGVSLLLRPLWLAVAAFAGLAAVCAAPAAGADEAQERGLALLARAAQLEHLRSPETGPFRLRVTVKLLGLVDGAREGQYLLVAASPDQWFETTRFPGYMEATGLSDGQRWRKRNVIDKPYRFHEASRLLDVAAHLRLPPDAVVKRVVQRTVAGRPAFCVDASPTSDLWQKDMVGKAAISEVARSKDSEVALCFDGDTGALLSASYGGSLPRFEYEGLITLGAKAYPKTLRCYEGKELAVEATVEELVAQQTLEAEGSYAAPAGSEKWPACAAPDPPRLVVKKEAEDDTYARVQRQYGTVIALVEVGTDGTIHDLAFVQARGVLHDSVKQAVKNWRYQPATCNGVPVPAELYLAYTFRP
ncbi:MAG TPA: energy transducer TonB [Thermoanaerobaculaceae bacterium]|nr:energy transducer TonB [Thermoanaerobaculaceae bacterium]